MTVFWSRPPYPSSGIGVRYFLSLCLAYLSWLLPIILCRPSSLRPQNWSGKAHVLLQNSCVFPYPVIYGPSWFNSNFQIFWVKTLFCVPEFSMFQVAPWSVLRKDEVVGCKIQTSLGMIGKFLRRHRVDGVWRTRTIAKQAEIWLNSSDCRKLPLRNSSSLLKPHYSTGFLFLLSPSQLSR